MGKFEDFLGSNTGTLAVQGAGLLYDQFTMGQQMDNQIELMGIQQQNELALMEQAQQNQYALNVQGQQLQMDMWNQTNYGAQIEHMRKAGLNPALMYSKGPGAGGSTGSQTGGQAAKGSTGLGAAPKAPQFELYGLQAKMMQAQIDDINSQRNKRDGIDTELAVEERNNKIVDKELKKIKLEYNKKGYIDGNYLATMFNVLGKDPINNETDKKWLMNRVYTYFGVKLGAEILRSIGAIIPSLKPGKNKPITPKKTRNGNPIKPGEVKRAKDNTLPRMSPEQAFGNQYGNDGFMDVKFNKKDKWWE